MTILTVFETDDSGAPARRQWATSTLAEINRELDRVDVELERWRASSDLLPGADQEDVLAAYRSHVDRLMIRGGYRAADVVRMDPNHPERESLRTKFLAEHTHADDEVRFFVEGAAAFYLRKGTLVLKVVAARGDLLRLPAGLRHWFDMGPDPYFAAIRIFKSAVGWVANFTDDTIAERVPLYLP